MDITSRTIRALQGQYTQMETAMRAILAVADTEHRNLSPGEAAEMASLRRRSAEIRAEIEAERSTIRRDAQLDNQDLPAGAIALPGGGDFGGEQMRRAVGRAYGGRTFSAMFGAPPRSDWRGLGDLFGVLESGLTDQRLVAAAAGGSEGVGQDGGFLVPSEFAARMLDASLENEIVRPRARVEPMKFNSKTTAGLDTSDHSTNIGGLSGVWIGEGVSLAGQKPKLRALVLTARKLGILLPMTNEWVADAPDADATIQRWLTDGCSWFMDYAYLNGDGAGQPLGILNDPALIVVTKETGQAAATITYENVKAMYARLHPACVPNACWIANQGTRAQMLGLVQYVKNAAGTDFVGGSGVPIVKEGPNGEMSLLGMPLIFTEKLPALGAQGDIVLTDLTQYVVGLRQELSIAKSQHFYFDSDQMAYRILVRTDGRGAWSKAMTPKNGSTLSWAVTLQAR